MKHSRSYQIRRLTATAILSALAAVLMFPAFQFSIPFLWPGFLKYDFSDLPALIGAFAYGPIAGIVIELIKNLIHWPMTSTGGVGELANFLLGVAYVVPAGLIYHICKNKAGAVWGSVAGTLLAGIVGFPVNYFITYPFYTTVMPIEAIMGMYTALNPAADELWKALLMFNLPLTLVKGSINVLITFLIYKKISPLLHGKT